MQLLRTIFIIIAVYYAGKFLMRIFAPFLMKYAANKMEQKVKEQFNQHQAQQEKETPKESIHKTKSSKKVGDYIDFEEIE
jgi:predicted tellurium resistance membrane protein TerC